MYVHKLALESEFSSSNGWFARFCKQFNLVYLKNYQKKESVQDREPRVKLKVGRFPKDDGYNKHQIPLPFVFHMSDTYEELGQKKSGFGKIKPD